MLHLKLLIYNYRLITFGASVNEEKVATAFANAHISTFELACICLDTSLILPV